MSAYWVGLTGGIGSGKSTVATMFAQHGITIVDADLVARQVVQPGQPALRAIAAQFGAEYLQSDGHLDRSKLRAHIFSQPTAKAWLDELLHPLIREQMRAELAQATSHYAILMAPLLIENKLDSWVDDVLVVDVLPEQQMERTMQRDHNNADLVQAIMQHQCSRPERLARADHVINNQGDLAQLASQVSHLHKIYSQNAAEKLAKS